MAKKPPEENKIGGVKSTRETTQIDPTKGIDSVREVNPTGGVLGVGQVSGARVRRATREMTLAEREELFKMIDEEAEKMFGDSGISKEKKELVQSAVKMAVDSGLLSGDDDDNDDDANPTSPSAAKSTMKHKKKLI